MQLKKVRNVFVILVMTIMIIFGGNQQVFGVQGGGVSDVLDSTLALWVVNYLQGEVTLDEIEINQYDIDKLNEQKEIE